MGVRPCKQMRSEQRLQSAMSLGMSLGGAVFCLQKGGQERRGDGVAAREVGGELGKAGQQELSPWHVGYRTAGAMASSCSTLISLAGCKA